MLCNTTVKPSGYKEEDVIALPASYRSYYYNLIDLVEEIHYYEYFINSLTTEGDIVLEPFLGSANVISVLDDTRKFIGIDINPFSKVFADFLTNLPTQTEYKHAIGLLENSVKDKIKCLYLGKNRMSQHRKTLFSASLCS